MKYATIILTNLKTRMPTPAGVCSYVLCTITFTSQGVQDYQFACIRSGTVGQGRTCLLAWIDERYTTAKRPRKYPKTHSNLHIWWLMMKRWRSRSIDWRWIIYIKKQEWCERYHFASLQKLEFECYTLNSAAWAPAVLLQLRDWGTLCYRIARLGQDQCMMQLSVDAAWAPAVLLQLRDCDTFYVIGQL